MRRHNYKARDQYNDCITFGIEQLRTRPSPNEACPHDQARDLEGSIDVVVVVVKVKDRFDSLINLIFLFETDGDHDTQNYVHYLNGVDIHEEVICLKEVSVFIVKDLLEWIGFISAVEAPDARLEKFRKS